MRLKIYDYETVRLTAKRRTKAKHLWSSKGYKVPTYRRTKAGKVSRTSVDNLIRSHAYAVPVGYAFVEAVVVDGVPVYTADPRSESRPTTHPLSGGGRFRFIRTMADGETVQRTLYMLDLPQEVGEVQDIRVVFGWPKKNDREEEKDGSKEER